MPYKSKAQYAYLHANKPDIAKKFDEDSEGQDIESLPDKLADDSIIKKKKDKIGLPPTKDQLNQYGK